jgi:hypothetical protein
MPATAMSDTMPAMTAQPQFRHRPAPGLRARAGRQNQRGLATLVVVMVLFFIVAMVAAYTSRNMVFEQRASANQYRSTQSLEAAEAGVEWTLAMLNGGRVNNACQPVNDQTLGSFRSRYINTVNFDRGMTLNAGATLPLMPRCTLDATTGQWVCACPVADSTALPTVTSAAAAAQPFFRIRFYFPPPPGGLATPTLVSATNRLDVLRVESVGCSRADASCLAPNDAPANAATAPAGDAMSIVNAKVTLRSGLATPPGAPVTAEGSIDGGASASGEGPLVAINSDFGKPPFAITNGVTFIAGGNVGGHISPVTMPGTPARKSLRENDHQIQALGAVNRSAQTPPRSVHDRFFSSVFGMWPDTYKAQPSVLQVNCAAACTAVAINALANQYPGHAIWVTGDLNINADIGSAVAVSDPTTQSVLASEVTPNGPVLLIVEGNLTLSAGNVYGLVYRRAAPGAASPDWARGLGTTVINGALITEGNLLAGGNQTVIYDAALLNRLHTRVGTYVRVPGGWRDF